MSADEAGTPPSSETQAEPTGWEAEPESTHGSEPGPERPGAKRQEQIKGTNRICVYAGSNVGARPAYAAAAERLADTLVRRGLGVVYGGGNVGLMGVLADATLERGGEVIGVIPEAMLAREVGHRELSELRVVGSMHERKALMADLADGFVALPGGYGTIEELVEIVTWSQLGLHEKPCGLLDVEGFYAPLVAFFDHAVAEGFVRPQHRAMLLVDDDPDALLDAFTKWTPPAVHKWIDRDQT